MEPKKRYTLTVSLIFLQSASSRGIGSNGTRNGYKHVKK